MEAHSLLPYSVLPSDVVGIFRPPKRWVPLDNGLRGRGVLFMSFW